MSRLNQSAISNFALYVITKIIDKSFLSAEVLSSCWRYLVRLILKASKVIFQLTFNLKKNLSKVEFLPFGLWCSWCHLHTVLVRHLKTLASINNKWFIQIYHICNFIARRISFCLNCVNTYLTFHELKHRLV